MFFGLFSNWNHLVFYHPSLEKACLEQWNPVLSVFYLFIPGFLNKNNVEITLCTRNDTFQLIQRREMVEKGLTIPSFFFYFFAILNSFFTAVSATVIRQFSELCSRFGTSVQRDSLPRTHRLISSRNVTGNIVSRPTKMLEEPIKSIPTLQKRK